MAHLTLTETALTETETAELALATPVGLFEEEMRRVMRPFGRHGRFTLAMTEAGPGVGDHGEPEGYMATLVFSGLNISTEALDSLCNRALAKLQVCPERGPMLRGLIGYTNHADGEACVAHFRVFID